tara:strand:- start:23491 stop:24081 length:591 start_codon:yes stop_codon:yes gene_type:complete
MQCAFDTTAKEVLEHVFSYLHLVVFESIIQAPFADNIRKSMSIDEICAATSLHSRDAMKIIYDLQDNLFLEMSTASFEKRRIHVYGINYYKLFNFIHAKLSSMKDEIDYCDASNNMMYCMQCNMGYNIEECIDLNTFETKCPKNGMHYLDRSKDTSQEEQVISTLLRKVNALKSKTPLYVYHSHLNRSREGEDCAT